MFKNSVSHLPFCIILVLSPALGTTSCSVSLSNDQKINSSALNQCLYTGLNKVPSLHNKLDNERIFIPGASFALNSHFSSSLICISWFFVLSSTFLHSQNSKLFCISCYCGTCRQYLSVMSFSGHREVWALPQKCDIHRKEIVFWGAKVSKNRNMTHFSLCNSRLNKLDITTFYT